VKELDAVVGFSEFTSVHANCFTKFYECGD